MTDQATDPSGKGAVFFLSYARSNAADRIAGDPDRDYATLYYDLCSALARFAPLDRLHSLGAVSSGQRFTDDSPTVPDPARGIVECDVFLPVHQARYVQSEQCGRELAAFEARTWWAVAPSSEAILPILWAPIPPQWAVTQPAPYRTGQPDVDEEYLAKGLFWLQYSQPARYHHVVNGLARRVAEIVNRRTASRGMAAEPATLATTRQKADRQKLAVVILAPTSGQLSGAHDPQYGPSATDWAPFAADSAAPLAQILVELARDKGWEPEVAPFSPTDQRLFGVTEPDDPVVVVVDPRALDEERSRSAMEWLDQQVRPGIGIVVAWDPDGVSIPEQARLRDQMHRVLNRKFARRSPSLRIGAPIATSLQSFDLALAATADYTRIQLASQRLNRAPAAEENTR